MKTDNQTEQFLDTLFVGRCANCGKPLQRKSKNGRLPKFCNAQCRVAAWRAKQKAAREAKNDAL